MKIQTSPLVVGVARLNDHPFEIDVEIIAADLAVSIENEVTGLVVDAQGTETIAGDGNRRIDLVVDGETQGIDITVDDENVRKHLVGDMKTMIEGIIEPPALSVAESEKGARNPLALPIVSPRGDGDLDNDLPVRALPSMITSQGKGTGSTPEKPYDDLTKHFYTSDMVSIRFCDFSSDTQAAIGQKFTPSSQGMINVKEDVPFIIKRVEPGYLLGWVAHTSGGRGLKETPSIPESEYPKYMGVATEGHSNGSRGNDSPHRLLKVRGFRRSRNLKPKTHVFAGELIKVTLSSRPHLWGQLEPKYYWRLQRLSDFLIASPGTAAGRLDRIPRHFGLDVDALRELRTADDSLDEDMKAGLAHLDAIHKPRPSDDDSDADARSPRGPTTPNGRVPRPTTRQGARDVNTTAPPPATTQGTEKATQPRDQRRLSPTANATRDPRLPPSTGPRVTRPRDDDTASLSNTKRRRGS
ncbi:hypothetical protein J4E81_009818 [Alternaria sp. BMP 2799]|nr:hypothetical protein J4E81_009818 [Alternaria sp. BMP 2799]